MSYSRLSAVFVLALATACAGGQAPERGPALDSPECIKAPQAAGERDTDEMLCVGRKGEFCAYPLRMLAIHRIINDHLGGFILVAFDPLSGVGQVFERQIEGKEVFFDAAAAREGVPIMTDRETKSSWSMLTGEAVEGKLKGKKLTRIPSVQMAWSRWRTLHLDSYILKGDPRLAVAYTFRNSPATAMFAANSTASRSARVDKRMPAGTLVLGVTGSSQRAYPLLSLESTTGAHADKLDGRSIVALSDPASKAYAAYFSQADGRDLKFTAQSRNGARVFLDTGTGSVWTIEGICVEGPLKGKALEAVPGGVCRWYAWSLTYPKTEISRPRRAAATAPFFVAR